MNMTMTIDCGVIRSAPISRPSTPLGSSCLWLWLATSDHYPQNVLAGAGRAFVRTFSHAGRVEFLPCWHLLNTALDKVMSSLVPKPFGWCCKISEQVQKRNRFQPFSSKAFGQWVHTMAHCLTPSLCIGGIS